MAARLLCAACGAAGSAKRGELPGGWSGERGQVRCGDCVRAGRWAPPVTVRRMPAADRVRARAEAALRAHPERADSWLGDDAGTTGEVVATVRSDLERRGEIPCLQRLLGRDGKRRARHRPRLDREVLVALLRAHPDRSAAAIAREAGVSVSSVANLRRELAA